MASKESDTYNRLNPVIYNYLIKNCRSGDQVLDVGCNLGLLGKKVKDIIECSFDGIDQIQNNSQVFENGYREYYCLDLNIDSHLSEIQDNKYDFLILGDVLEHLIHPAQILKQLKNKMKPDGRIIISLPNICFIYYRLSHLFGYWNYSNNGGIMDKTHLRFYSVATMKESISACGLCVLDYYGVSITKKMRNAFKLLARIFPSVFAIQVVFIARSI